MPVGPAGEIDDERSGRHRPVVPQRMHRAAWDVDEIPRLRVDRLPARLERGGALQNIEGLVLEVVNVRRRASSRRSHALNDETASVRFRARDQKGYPVARPAIHRACSCWHILDLILIRHGCDSFRCW